MGIYPTLKNVDFSQHPDGRWSWTEVESVPGLIRRRRVVAEPWVEERTNCFCCSCDELSSDPACRNHGFAGTRPCEVHNMPGQPWDHSGEMPDSVQAHRVKAGG